jgi:plastocyanin
MAHQARFAPSVSTRTRIGLGLTLGLFLAGSSVASFGGSAGASGSSKSKVDATLTEYHIALSKKSFAPGAYVFVAQNKGHEEHALAITGPGLSNKKTALLSPGQSAKLNVTLRKGSYDIFCPVPGHKALGMNVTIAVKVGGSSSTGSTSSSTKKGSSGGGYGY